MFSTELSTPFALFSGLLTIFCVFLTVYALRLAHFCRSAVEYVQMQNKRAVSLRRMAEVESTLTDLTDSYDSLLSSHKKLRSRIGMRKLREKETSVKPVDDLGSTDKRIVRMAARKSGLLK